MGSALTPHTSVITELGLRAALLLAHHAVAAERDIASDPVVWHRAVGSTFAPHHDFLAEEMLVGLLQASLADAQPAAAAESAAEDVLGAHAAVGGLPEEVRARRPPPSSHGGAEPLSGVRDAAPGAQPG